MSGADRYWQKAEGKVQHSEEGKVDGRQQAKGNLQAFKREAT